MTYECEKSDLYKVRWNNAYKHNRVRMKGPDLYKVRVQNTRHMWQSDLDYVNSFSCCWQPTTPHTEKLPWRSSGENVSLFRSLPLDSIIDTPGPLTDVSPPWQVDCLLKISTARVAFLHQSRGGASAVDHKTSCSWSWSNQPTPLVAWCLE